MVSAVARRCVASTIQGSLFKIQPLLAPTRFTPIHHIKTLSTFTAVPETMDLRESVRNQTAVALGMTKQLLLTKGKGKNMVYSPLSIHSVLSLIAAGTKGPTHEQLLSFLKSKSIDHLNSLASNLVSHVLADGSPSGGPCLSYANGVWVEKSLPIKPYFKHVVDSAYKAAIDQVDFMNKAEEVIDEVNSWAEKETKGLITQILPRNSVDRETMLIITNALYFKGVWNEKFDSSITEKHDFHLGDGRSKVTAPFVTSMKRQYISAYDGFKVLKLPYKQGKDKARRFSMYMFLPDAKDGLPGLVDKVCSELDFVDRHVPDNKVKVGDFKIPKFKFSSGFEACQIVKNLGLVLPFVVSDKGGNLTEMVDSPPGTDPYVSKIFHKSCIEVNEEGTKAAAVTAVGMRCGSAYCSLEEIDFVADHPFLFLIREEMAGTVLFIGQVLNPLEE